MGETPRENSRDFGGVDEPSCTLSVVVVRPPCDFVRTHGTVFGNEGILQFVN